jgi:hypothetical protein
MQATTRLATKRAAVVEGEGRIILRVGLPGTAVLIVLSH